MEAKVTFLNVLNMTKKYLVDQKYNNEQFSSLPPILKRYFLRSYLNKTTNKFYIVKNIFKLVSR